MQDIIDFQELHESLLQWCALHYYQYLQFRIHPQYTHDTPMTHLWFAIHHDTITHNMKRKDMFYKKRLFINEIFSIHEKVSWPVYLNWEKSYFTIIIIFLSIYFLFFFSLYYINLVRLIDNLLQMPLMYYKIRFYYIVRHQFI